MPLNAMFGHGIAVKRSGPASGEDQVVESRKKQRQGDNSVTETVSSKFWLSALSISRILAAACPHKPGECPSACGRGTWTSGVHRFSEPTDSEIILFQYIQASDDAIDLSIKVKIADGQCTVTPLRFGNIPQSFDKKSQTLVTDLLGGSDIAFKTSTFFSSFARQVPVHNSAIIVPFQHLETLLVWLLPEIEKAHCCEGVCQCVSADTDNDIFMKRCKSTAQTTKTSHLTALCLCRLLLNPES
jgi:hypothetical protein